MKTPYVFIGFILVSALLLPAAVEGQAAALSHQALGGVWMLDRDRSTTDRGLPAGGDTPSGGRDGDAPRGGGRRGGGFGGFGGRRGSGGGGGFGGGQAVDLDRMQAVANYLRTMMIPSDRLTIVVTGGAVDIVEANGARLGLQTDNRKVNERAENGLVKLTRKSHWNGNDLVTEMDIENGPKIARTYAVSSTGSELQISTAAGGARGGRRDTHPVVQVYERFEPAP